MSIETMTIEYEGKSVTLDADKMDRFLSGTLIGSSKVNQYSVPEDKEFENSESGFISAPTL